MILPAMLAEATSKMQPAGFHSSRLHPGHQILLGLWMLPAALAARRVRDYATLMATADTCMRFVDSAPPPVTARSI